jgi:hypothetical protein
MTNFIWLHVSTRSESSSGHLNLLLLPNSRYKWNVSSLRGPIRFIYIVAIDWHFLSFVFSIIIRNKMEYSRLKWYIHVDWQQWGKCIKKFNSQHRVGRGCFYNIFTKRLESSGQKTADMFPKLLRRSAVGFTRESFKLPLLDFKCVHEQNNARGQRVERAWHRGYWDPFTALTYDSCLTDITNSLLFYYVYYSCRLLIIAKYMDIWYCLTGQGVLLNAIHTARYCKQKSMLPFVKRSWNEI